MNLDLEPLMSIIKKYTLSSKVNLPIARDGSIRINYFLDLLSASHVDTHRLVMARTFIEWLTYHNVDKKVFDVVAGPKRGNSLFIKSVADELCARSAFVKENILFGRRFEGDVRPGDRVLLVDDVASDGELLIDAVENLSLSGATVVSAIVLVNRLEGDALFRFRQSKIDFRYLVCLSDDDLSTSKI